MWHEFMETVCEVLSLSWEKFKLQKLDPLRDSY